jgi:hypothetical protein
MSAITLLQNRVCANPARLRQVSISGDALEKAVVFCC